MSPLNPFSLVESSQHSKATLELLKLKINRNLINYIVKTTVDAVEYAYDGPSTSDSESESRGRSKSRSNKHASFTNFVSNVITRSEVTVGVLLVALVYIKRAKPYLSIETMEWAHERVFLGALMLAHKYTNDSTLLNVHWALVTGTFGKNDANRIEREFLDVLDYELGISESDILDHHHSLMAIHPRSQHRVRIVSSPAPAARRAVSPATSEDLAFSSDSSAPSTPLPLTPVTPAHPHLPTKVQSYFGEYPFSHLSVIGTQMESLPITDTIQVAA